MLDDTFQYFQTCELSSLRHKRPGPLNFPFYDGSPRQGTWRLAEAILESIGMNEAGDNTAPGTAMFLGRDLGPLLAYLANILGQTRIFGLMDNVHVADHARNSLREQDLVLRVPVFAGNAADASSYRIMQVIPWFFSVDTLFSRPDTENVLAILSEKMPVDGVLWASGYFPGTPAHHDRERLLLDRALAHVGLLHGQLKPMVEWESYFSQAGFINTGSTVLENVSIEDLSSVLKLRFRCLTGIFTKPYEGARDTWNGEIALRKALSMGLLHYGWMQFRKT